MPLVPINKARRRVRQPGWQDVRPEDKEQRDAWAIQANHENKLTRSTLRVMREIFDEQMEAIVREALKKKGATVESVMSAIPFFDTNRRETFHIWRGHANRLKVALTSVVDESSKNEARARGWKIPSVLTKQEIPTLPANPTAVQWIENRSLANAVELSRSEAGRTREILTEAFERGIHPQPGRRGKAISKVIEDIKQTVGLTPKQHQRVRNRVESSIEAGLSSDAAEAVGSKFSEDLRVQRARTIARTEVNEAQNIAVLDTWKSAEDAGLMPAGTKKKWVAADQSPRLSPICEELSSHEPIPVDEPFSGEAEGMSFTGMAPPAHPNCLPGGTMVLAEGVTAKSMRWYDGDLVIIKTARGKSISCTPNHPVLGDHGWSAAKRFKIGDHIICSSRSDWISSGIVKNKQNGPTELHKIKDFPLVFPSTFTRRVPVSAEDFHGDGEGSEVAIINSYRNFRGQSAIAFLKKFRELGFDWRAVCSLFLTPLSAPFFRNYAISVSSAANVCSSSQLYPFQRRSTRHTDKHSFAPSPKLFSSSPQSSTNSWLADCEGFRERLNAMAAPVFKDKIIDVNVLNFSGHVYNLETDEGFYIANNVVTHNCRSTIALVFPGE